jgi:hypothetical protein
MYKNLKNKISRNLQAAIGSTTNRKLLVIESDDWGSIRMPNKLAYHNLLKKGIPVDKSPYNKLDNLETEEDFLVLFELLNKIKDSKGNSLKITANTIMANPDFEKIRTSNFKEYHYMELSDTYNHFNGNTKALELFKEGINNNLLTPQLHGREHLHPLEWLKALRENDITTTEAFDEKVWGHPNNYFKDTKMNFSSAFHLLDEEHHTFGENALMEAAKIFRDTFDFKSDSFIAPRYIWNSKIEGILNNIGVKYIQGKIIQLCPIPNNPYKFKNKVNYLGKKNKFGQTYLTRNVFFEPAQNQKFDWLNDAMERIRIAYKWKKPAIISMHRLNFMGGLDIDNRKENLELLQVLINKVISEFPEVEFLSSNELGKILNNE